MEIIAKQAESIGRATHYFSPYQIQMADKIFELITRKDYKEIGKLVNTIRTKVDYKYIHYAFYHKYEFGWLSWVQKYCSNDQCIKYGLYNYNF